MALTGLFILFFVVVHVRTFKFGPWYVDAATGHRDLYRLVAEIYRNPLYAGFYIVAMGLIGMHLNHGHLECRAVARPVEPAHRRAAWCSVAASWPW